MSGRLQLARWGPPAAIVVMALAIRVWTWVGPDMAWLSDESRFIAVAKNMSGGYFPEGPTEWFGTRLVLLAPVAGLFRVFGASDTTVAIWPLVGSLLSVLAAYLLGRDLADRRIGLVAAGLVAVAPLEARLAMFLRPDSLVPALIALSVWCALRAGRSEHHVVRWALAAGVLLGLGWSARENAVVMAPVVAAAGWPAVRRAIAPGVAGFAAIPLLGALIWAAAGRNPGDAVFGAGAEGVFRNPIAAWNTHDSYIAMLWRASLDRHDLLFFALPLVAATISVHWFRGERRAVLPLLWLGWGYLYLEFGTLMNLAKPNRYLTLLVIPAALLIALMFDGKGAWIPVAVAVGMAIWVLWTLPARDLRGDDVALFSRVSARLATLPSAPVATESYTWWAKFRTYRARSRLTIPQVQDPTFVSPERARQLRIMEPLPNPADASGGYVVTGPVHERRGWPTNWDTYRSNLRQAVPTPSQLELVARVGSARIWRWRAP